VDQAGAWRCQASSRKRHEPSTSMASAEATECRIALGCQRGAVARRALAGARHRHGSVTNCPQAGSGDGGSRTHDLLVASEALCHQSFVPMRTGGVEPPQREAAGLQPVELSRAQRPRDELGWPNGLEPIPAGLTTPGAALHHGHHEPSTGTTGLEPASSRLTSERSARLSYAPNKLRGWDSNPRSRAHEAREDGLSSTALRTDASAKPTRPPSGIASDAFGHGLAGRSRTCGLRFPKPAGWPSSLQPDAKKPPTGFEPVPPG
jgi:hypothetical protein